MISLFAEQNCYKIYWGSLLWNPILFSLFNWCRSWLIRLVLAGVLHTNKRQALEKLSYEYVLTYLGMYIVYPGKKTLESRFSAKL